MQRYTNHELEALLNVFDIYPVPSAKITDISKKIFENEYLPLAFAANALEDNNIFYRERLASCKMGVSPDDTLPTVLGLLSIGNTHQDFIPGTCIQCLRITGIQTLVKY
nr:hypothetical protein [uncultured Desulfobacter sp.]